MADLPPEVEAFLDGLVPTDVGHEAFGALVLRFEGFVHDCWTDFERRFGGDPNGIAAIQAEIEADWLSRHPGMALLASGWTHEPLPHEDTLLWALLAPQRSAPPLAGA